MVLKSNVMAYQDFQDKIKAKSFSAQTPILHIFNVNLVGHFRFLANVQ